MCSMKLTLTSALTAHLALRDTPDFISPLQWPPSSPDLKTVDYAIWVKLQKRVYRTRICDVDHLVERFVEEWSRFDHEIIIVAVTERQLVCVCVTADGGHFQHFLQLGFAKAHHLIPIEEKWRWP